MTTRRTATDPAAAASTSPPPGTPSWTGTTRGKQPLAFLSPEAKAASGQQVRPDGIATFRAWRSPRWPSGCGSPDSPVTPSCGPTGSATISTRPSGVAHREALLLGDSFVIVWADPFGRPKVTVESAKQVAVLTDPGTRQITAAVKRWETDNDAPRPCCTCRIGSCGCGPTRPVPPHRDSTRSRRSPTRWASCRSSISATVTAFSPTTGASEIDDLKPLVDGLNKSLTDMLVTCEYVGRPRRWATGIELIEEPVLDDEGNPSSTTTTSR